MAGDIETYTVLRPPGRDKFGDQLTGPTAEFDLPGCQLAPGPSTEAVLPGANTVDTDGTVYAPPDADVRETDQMLIRGELYNVVGKPQLWGTFGTVIAVRRVTG